MTSGRVIVVGLARKMSLLKFRGPNRPEKEPRFRLEFGSDGNCKKRSIAIDRRVSARDFSCKNSEKVCCTLFCSHRKTEKKKTLL